MTTITEENFKQKNQYIEQADSQMDKWRQGLDRLERETRNYPPEVGANYSHQIGTLRKQFERVEYDFNKMESAGQDQWEMARYEWGKTAAQYWQSFTTLADHIIKERQVPLGWVQGLTDHRFQESAGWAEGFGLRPSGSEGWAEGSGKREDSSRGWAEGYEDKS